MGTDIDSQKCWQQVPDALGGRVVGDALRSRRTFAFVLHIWRRNLRLRRSCRWKLSVRQPPDLSSISRGSCTRTAECCTKIIENPFSPASARGLARLPGHPGSWASSGRFERLQLERLTASRISPNFRARLHPKPNEIVPGDERWGIIGSFANSSLLRRKNRNFHHTMIARAIHAMQFQLICESGTRHEAFPVSRFACAARP